MRIKRIVIHAVAGLEYQLVIVDNDAHTALKYVIEFMAGVRIGLQLRVGLRQKSYQQRFDLAVCEVVGQVCIVIVGTPCLLYTSRCV